MTKRMTTEEFIAKAKDKHGDRYSYSKSKYERNSVNVTITCNKHGDFDQSPNSHLMGRGCRKCGLVTKVAGRRKPTDKFIEQAKSVHGGVYTYEHAIYQNAFKKICITCPEHGDFWIAPNCLLSGQRCYECALIARGLSRRNTFDEFLAGAKETHGEKYEYIESSYTDASSKMTIVCPDHGEFKQSPKSHVYGRGCHGCVVTGFNPSKPAHIYCLKSDDGAFLKVGITGDIKSRVSSLQSATPFKFKIVGKIDIAGSEARQAEKDIHNRFMSAGLKGFQGCTEWLRYDEDIISLFN